MCIRLGASRGNRHDFHVMFVSLGGRAKRKYDPG